MNTEERDQSTSEDSGSSLAAQTPAVNTGTLLEEGCHHISNRDVPKWNAWLEKNLSHLR